MSLKFAAFVIDVHPVFVYVGVDASFNQILLKVAAIWGGLSGGGPGIVTRPRGG